MKDVSDVMTSPLTSWTDAPAADRGIRFWRNGDWEWWAYQPLAAFARRIAAGIAASGIRHDDRVLIVERTGPEFVAALYGIMLAGAVPCPVAPPHLFQSAELYARHLHAIGAAARPAMVLTAASLAERLVVGGHDTQVRTAAELARAGDWTGDWAAAPAASVALLQFTSGSSGRVKGVRVPVAALAANVAAIGAWLEMADGDATASWLPVHHDMGLIGCLLTPVAQQRDLWLLEPADFVRDPARYLACFSAPGAAMTAMPPFGLDYIVRRISPESLAGSDFSGWRALIIGAERIDVGLLNRFMALIGPFGFDRRALLPAYGLAEATLAVTGLALREELRTVQVAPQRVSLGGPVRSTGADAQPVVGCGRALDGVTVAVFDEAGEPLPDRHVGQIVVRGASVAEGYVHGEGSVSLTRWRDGALWTGDAGFLDDGQLFVIGRLGDAMKVRGRTVFAEDIDSALVEAGVPRLRAAVLLGSTARGATGVILLERPEHDWIEAAAATLRRITDGASIVILDVPRRSISRTTSGKPKRREMWAAYVAGSLDGIEVDAALPA
jgi:acyl-CoA synthetase (AMP-forming)/AMP-acid ligase II